MKKLEKTTQFIMSGDISLAVYHWGQIVADKPSIVLIHGYPDSTEVWNQMAKHLHPEFNVYAYDVRGTGQSDIPKNQSEYAFKYLVQDLSTVISLVSPKQPVHVVGHDWGSLQGWEAVLGDTLKSQIKSYTAMTPSVDHVGWWFKRQWNQGSFQGYRNVVTRAISSGYMAMFQLPLLPELTWRLGLTKIWPSIVGYMENTNAHVDPYQLRNSISGLGLYRENLVQPLRNPSQRKTTIPVHMLVMTKDPFVPSFMSQGMEEWVTDVQYSEVAAGHWGIVSHTQQIANTIKSYIFDKF